MTFYTNKFASEFFAPSVIILGTIGNLFGIIVISSKKLKPIGPQNILICMFTLDCIYLPLILHPYLAYEFKINITIFSSLTCKLYWYARYSMAFISPMMNVYVSVERFISITFPAKKLFLQKKNIQNIYILAIVLANILLAVGTAFYFDVKNLVVQLPGINQTNSSMTYCDFVNIYSQNLSGLIDLISRVIIPNVLMIIFSLLITASILKSRNRMLRNFNHVNNALFRKDVRFAVTSICLNLFYILFSLPVSIVVLLPNYADNEFYILFSYLFFVDYCANFYIMLTFNKLFRGIFLQILTKSFSKHRQESR